MRRVELTEEARQNLKDIFLYIAEEGYPDRAEKQVRVLMKQCDVLALSPKIGTKRNVQGYETRMFSVSGINIYYQFDDECLVVYSFYHGRRNPDDVIIRFP